MSSKTLAIVAAVLGVGLVAVALFYWLTPANALPSFMPGYDPTLASVHVKHGVAAVLLGLACFAFAWFESGKKKKTA